MKVEQLEDVERAFVHLDFEFHHDPASEHKQWGVGPARTASLHDDTDA